MKFVFLSIYSAVGMQLLESIPEVAQKTIIEYSRDPTVPLDLQTLSEIAANPEALQKGATRFYDTEIEILPDETAWNPCEGILWDSVKFRGVGKKDFNACKQLSATNKFWKGECDAHFGFVKEISEVCTEYPPLYAPRFVYGKKTACRLVNQWLEEVWKRNQGVFEARFERTTTWVPPVVLQSGDEQTHVKLSRDEVEIELKERVVCPLAESGFVERGISFRGGNQAEYGQPYSVYYQLDCLRDTAPL